MMMVMIMLLLMTMIIMIMMMVNKNYKRDDCFVAVAPVLSLGSFDPLIVREGSSVVLNCSVYANPPVDDATITWLRNGSVISEYLINFLSFFLSKGAILAHLLYAIAHALRRETPIQRSRSSRERL